MRKNIFLNKLHHTGQEVAQFYRASFCKHNFVDFAFVCKHNSVDFAFVCKHNSVDFAFVCKHNSVDFAFVCQHTVIETCSKTFATCISRITPISNAWNLDYCYCRTLIKYRLHKFEETCQ